MDGKTREISFRAGSRGELQVELCEDNDMNGRRPMRMRSSYGRTLHGS